MTLKTKKWSQHFYRIRESIRVCYVISEKLPKISILNVTAVRLFKNHFERPFTSINANGKT